MIPGSGGEGQYLDKGFGPLMVFLFNWTSILILKPGTVAILSVASATYLLRMIFNIFGLSVATDSSTGNLSSLQYTWIEKSIAIGCCLLVTLASVISVKWSMRIQSVLTLGKVGALAVIIISSVYYAIFNDPSVIKENLGSPFAGSIFSLTGLALALNNGLWAYEGWNNLNIVAGSLANPAINLPLGIWISVCLVIGLYVLTLFGYYSVLSKEAVALSTTTIGIDFGIKVFGAFGNILIPIFIIASTFSSALSSMVTSSEVVVLAADARQIPRFFRKISPTFGTAARAYWLQGILSVILVTMMGFEGLILVYTFPAWIFYAACVLVLLKLRWTEPEWDRPYRVFITTPILFLFACALLLVASAIADPIPIGISIGVVLFGIPLYYVLLFLFNDKFGSQRSVQKSEMSMVERKN